MWLDEGPREITAPVVYLGLLGYSLIGHTLQRVPPVSGRGHWSAHIHVVGAGLQPLECSKTDVQGPEQPRRNGGLFGATLHPWEGGFGKARLWMLPARWPLS